VPAELAEFLRREARLDARLQQFYRTLGPLARFAPRLDPFALARAIIQEVSRQIAEGNLRVYAELAPLFAEFAANVCHPPEAGDETLHAFVARLASGTAADGGQDHLKEAFRSYYAAAFSDHEPDRTQRILLANVLIGLHEQTRLQENIAGALDAPFSERVYERFGGAGPRMLHAILRSILRNGVRLFARGLLADWRRIATHLLMKLAAPNGDEIPLGKDLPPESFDPLLTTLTLPALVALLTRFDPDLTTTRGSGATDWTVLGDRMRFIGELFRVSQRDPSWFDQPFDAAQRVDIEAGRVPMGRL
jgi:hypothetical protein